MKNWILGLGLCLFLTQCNVTRFTGSAPNPPVARLAVVKNDKVHMSGLQPEIISQVNQMGITTTLVDAPPPGDEYYLTFTANWAWDLAMYLRYFQAELHKGPVMVGRVEYKTSGFDMGKFGHTDNKIRPLLRRLITGEKSAKR